MNRTRFGKLTFHFKQADPERPVIDGQEGELHPVRIGDHRQVFWLKVDGPRTSHGYKNIKVLDKPLRTQAAIVALLTILEANLVDTEQLHEALSNVESPLESSVSDRWADAWWGRLGDEGFAWNERIQLHRFRYVLALLRHYRPDFDALSHEEQVGLISQTAERVNSFLTASRQLVEFLEYGSPDRDLREAAEGASRDVRAAVLKDVEGSTLLQIAERFGLSITDKQRDEYDHPRVRQMVKRGRRMLEGVLGKNGWQQQIEAMKAEAAWYRSLSTKEKAIQYMVDEGIPFEEARRHIEEVGRRSDGSMRRGMLLPGDPD